MSEFIWYHGNITKQQALERFRQFHPDGSFLVRKSETLLNTFALSVGYQNNVYHYRIPQDVNQRFLFEGRSFYSLAEFVTYYQANKGILVCMLKHPVLPPLPPAQAPKYDPVYVSAGNDGNQGPYEEPLYNVMT